MRGLVLLVACAAVGCGAGKLSFEKSFSLPTDANADMAQYDLPAQGAEQTITVEYSVTGEPVDVFVVYATERDGFDGLTNDKREKRSAASARKVEAGKLPAKIPANTAYSVVVAQTSGGAKKSQVKLKITN